MEKIKLLTLIIFLVLFRTAYSQDSFPTRGQLQKHGMYKEKSAQLTHPYTIFGETKTVDLLIVAINNTRDKIMDTSTISKKVFYSLYKSNVYSKAKFDSAPEHCKNYAFSYLIGLNGDGNELRDTITTGGGATQNCFSSHSHKRKMAPY